MERDKVNAMMTLRKLAHVVEYENKVCEIRPMDLLNEFSALRQNNKFYMDICKDDFIVMLVETILLDIEYSLFK